MNLATEVQEIHDSLFNGDVDIAIFALDGMHYYIIDSKDNYCIDVRPEYDAYIQNGWLKPENLDDALNSFRGGIPLLEKSNFFEYLKLANVKCFTKSWMYSFFIHNKTKEDLCSFYSYIEDFLSTHNEKVRPEWDEWRLRLPKFYINFDKKFISILIGKEITKAWSHRIGILKKTICLDCSYLIENNIGSLTG